MTFSIQNEEPPKHDPELHSIGSAAKLACDLVYRDRRKEYSDPIIEFEKIGALWTEILGKPVSAEQYCLCMIAMKLVRESGNHKRDNIIDMIGYAQILDDLRMRK